MHACPPCASCSSSVVVLRIGIATRTSQRLNVQARDGMIAVHIHPDYFDWLFATLEGFDNCCALHGDAATLAMDDECVLRSARRIVLHDGSHHWSVPVDRVAMTQFWSVPLPVSADAHGIRDTDFLSLGTFTWSSVAFVVCITLGRALSVRIAIPSISVN